MERSQYPHRPNVPTRETLAIVRYEGDPNGVAKLEKVLLRTKFEDEVEGPSDVAEDALGDESEANENANRIYE